MTEQPTPEQQAAIREQVEQFAAVMHDFLVAAIPIVRAAAEAIATMAAAVEKARTATQADFALAPPRDRPAWQSPHGPAHTRRKG